MLIEVDWQDRILNAGWHVHSSSQIDEAIHLFSRIDLLRAPRNLRDEKVVETFERFIGRSRTFKDWWLLTCGGESPSDKISDKIFVLRFAGGAWNIPWELLIDPLGKPSRRATVSLVRSTSAQSLSIPSAFDEPLRILVLQGADRKSVNERPLDLDAEATQIDEAWRELEQNIQECVERPIVKRAKLNDIVSALQAHRPHMLWFSGHGGSKSNQALLLDGREWVSAASFAREIETSKHIPLYVVFWACDTGQTPDRENPVPAIPALFQELSRIGILSVLAMQSRIKDVSARQMARDLLSYLALGFSFEIALSRTRAIALDGLRERFGTTAHPLDWAAPVIWSNTKTVERLKWNTKSQPFALLQLVGRQILRCRLDQPHQLDSALTSELLQRAEIWVTTKRIWVRQTSNSAAQSYQWVRTLQAVQHKTHRFIVAVDIDDASKPAESLQDWAQKIINRLFHGDIPEQIIQLLGEIARTPTTGWAKLCRQSNVFLAISNPPKYLSPGWFWEPLSISVNDLPIVVLSQQDISDQISEDWSFEQADIMDESRVSQAVTTAPRLAQALAVLNMPLGTYYINELGKSTGENLQTWAERNVVLIETSAGPIMTASARQHVLSRMTGEDLQQAHHDCADLLGHQDLQLTISIREHRLTHLLGADMIDEALNEAGTLCCLYRAEDRPFSVLKVVEKLGKNQVDLPQEARLCVAWAYAQSSRIREALYWLNRANPQKTLEKAWKHGLRAELHKNEGDKEAALREVEAAIEICKTAGFSDTPRALVERRLRAYQQDKARILQYLFYKVEDAKTEYERLIKEWSSEPDATIDLAVVKRNYAECLRTLASDQLDARWQRAKEVLIEAEKLARPFSELPVLAEILYEKAKLAEKEQGGLPSARHYLQESQNAAQQSWHFMMLAIARSRYFWKTEQVFPEALSAWNEIEAELISFPHHGWAIRVLIDGRTRIAKHLVSLGDMAEANTKLMANLGDLQRNPAFNQGSDRFRIARTLAGLDVVNQRKSPVSWWEEFLRDYEWSQEWLADKTGKTPEAIWVEVT